MAVVIEEAMVIMAASPAIQACVRCGLGDGGQEATLAGSCCARTAQLWGTGVECRAGRALARRARAWMG